MERQNAELIWDGAVGVRIEAKNNRDTGESFFTFEPVRCFKRDGNERFEYSHTFTERNAEALGNVIAKALVYMRENSPASVGSA